MLLHRGQKGRYDVTTFDLALTNLTSPPVLAFALGAFAVAMRSELRLPDPVHAALSTYLLLAIGIKGGHELQGVDLSEFWAPLLATIALGVTIPFVAFVVARRFVRLDVTNAGAIAAHYGSVSVVTFTATLAFLDQSGVRVEGFMVALVAVLEVPAIIIGLAIVAVRLGGRSEWRPAVREVLAGRSVLLLVGGIVIGLAADTTAYEKIAPVFVTLFTGLLVLFLLDLGSLAAHRLREEGRVSPRLVAFGILLPACNGTAGVLLGTVTGLSVGGSTVLGIMAGSASYIAATAAVRIALPDANPGYYLTASLAITFPFNLVVGIPLMHEIARAVG